MLQREAGKQGSKRNASIKLRKVEKLRGAFRRL